jgi:DNA-binding response OmpR family regulator
MKRRILLVDDEVAVLLTLKAVLEISGFEVDTAASAREGKSRLHKQEYHMVITDMRMERESSGHEVIAAARAASSNPAIALLTAFPVSDDDWQDAGADKLLVKPMQTRVLLQQIEKLFAAREARQAVVAANSPGVAVEALPIEVPPAARKAAARKTVAKKTPAKKTVAKRVAAKKTVAKRVAAKKTASRPGAKKAVKPAKPARKAPKKSAAKGGKAAKTAPSRTSKKTPGRKKP